MTHYRCVFVLSSALLFPLITTSSLFLHADKVTIRLQTELWFVCHTCVNAHCYVHIHTCSVWSEKQVCVFGCVLSISFCSVTWAFFSERNLKEYFTACTTHLTHTWSRWILGGQEHRWTKREQQTREWQNTMTDEWGQRIVCHLIPTYTPQHKNNKQQTKTIPH